MFFHSLAKLPDNYYISYDLGSEKLCIEPSAAWFEVISKLKFVGGGIKLW